jgi:organic hydroperoxide reductase OsmC/OhrA
VTPPKTDADSKADMLTDGRALAATPSERHGDNVAHHTASVIWERAEGAKFTDNRYSRAHRWQFDGGAVVPASSSPAVVPAPLSDPAGVDPEEAFVASLSSCHMLWFLFYAAKGGFMVESYRDEAVGHMEKTPEGSQWMSSVVLHPEIRFAGSAPDAAKLAEMHDQAHHACFIANSVRTVVTVESG